MPDTTAPAVHLTTPSRDKYGRPVVTAYFGRFIFDGPAQAVMVTLPKASRELDGRTHLVNVWKGERGANGQTPVHYATSRREALAILNREVRALHS